ncbi:hypothetical protein PDIDSM_2477 [Penicillium digitatum]|nr:hypothetical protein PDIDSM_2477 [Penicillium digitatum]
MGDRQGYKVSVLDFPELLALKLNRERDVQFWPGGAISLALKKDMQAMSQLCFLIAKD